MFKNYFKILNISAIILGVIVIFTPVFIAPPCDSLLELKSGMMTHMVCFWTSHAVILNGILILSTAIMIMIAKNAETVRYLSIIQLLMSFTLILWQQSFVIGICKMDMGKCHHMASVLTIPASLLILISLVKIFRSEEFKDTQGINS